MSSNKEPKAVPRPLSEISAAKLRELIDNATANPDGVPGCVFATINGEGKSLFAHSSGSRSIESGECMTLDTMFWLASFTKLVTSIAALQLAEIGTFALDDADLVEKLCPELYSLEILKSFDTDGKPCMTRREGRVTVAQLLSHTGKSEQQST